MTFQYDIPSLIPHIDWSYYHHAWMVKGGTHEAEVLQEDALEWLSQHQEEFVVRGICQSFEAHREKDDIVIMPCENAKPQHIPMLRQQNAGPDGHTLSLADFIRPDRDTVLLFATTANISDDSLIAQTLAVRLAEAAAEKLDHDLHQVPPGHPTGSLRPAIGYPCLPDLSVNFLIANLIDINSIGIRLTQNGAMQPQASVSGFIINEPRAKYFAVGTISEEQLIDYAHRRHLAADTLRPYLRSITT